MYDEQRGAGSGITLKVVTQMAAAESTWRAFEQHADFTVFQKFDWLDEWSTHIGNRLGIIQAIVFAVDTDGELLLILPFAIKKQGLLRRLIWLGGDLNDYNAPLLSPTFSACMSQGRFALLWREICRAIWADPRLRFDIIDLDRMPEWIGPQRNPFLVLRLLPNTYGAYVTKLGKTWEEFYSKKISSKSRKNDRKKFKSLAKYGKLQFVDVHEKEDMERTIAALIKQKGKSYAKLGVEDIFNRPGYCQFFKAIAVNPGLRDTVHLSRLDVDNQPTATALGLGFKSRYYLVLSSYEDNEIAKYSPGRAHLHGMMRHAIEREYNEFDFTIGDEMYKKEWSDLEIRLFDYLQGETAGGRLAAAVGVTARHVQLFVCERPALRRPLSKLRRLLIAFNARRRSGQVLESGRIRHVKQGEGGVDLDEKPLPGW